VVSSDSASEVLEQEIRRLRIRLAGLTPAQMTAAGPLVRAALVELSALTSDARPVPDYGQRALPDQLLVMLRDCLPECGAQDAWCAAGGELAAGLRRDLGDI
jgi:hypothetical protein